MALVLMVCLLYGLLLYGLLLIACCLAGVLQKQNRLGFRPYMSLLISVRDQSFVIEGVIRSILRLHHSSLPPFELIVVDSFSSDETPEIIKCLSREYPYAVRYRGRTRGRCEAENPFYAGLKACEGDVVCCFNLTDKICPGRVAGVVKSILKGEEIRNDIGCCTVTVTRK